MAFKEITAQEFPYNPFELIGKDWTLITAKKEDKVNAMTASWGGMGVLWGKNVVYIFIRDSRYTKEFVDNSDTFSLAFFDTEKERENLTYFGRVSGRDEDKIAKVGYHVAMDGETPYFEEAKTILICRKLSMHRLDMEGMIDQGIEPAHYANGDYHNMYVGAIEKILVNE